MAIEVKLPELGDGIESGDILEVLVKEGDELTKDQSVVEIETDKATVEVPTPNAGKVAQIHVAAGDTVAIGATLVTLEAGADTAASESAKTPAAASPPSPPPAPPKAPEPTPAPAASSPPTPQPTQPAATSAPINPPLAPTKPPAPPAHPKAMPASGAPIAAGPAIRRFAREVGVDLSTVNGSGDGGRITREDVLEVVRRANKAVSSGAVDSANDENPLPGDAAADDWGPISVEKAARIRQTIASKMHESWSTVPRVTNFDDADVTELEVMRQTSKADYAAQGIKLTSMPFIIKAVSMALKNHPLINATYDPDQNQITYKRYVNVGVAVDTDRGLMVPALRKTDQLSISETAKALATVADKVRTGNFSLDDLRGGTFTISNLGAIGGQYSTPIVNVPELAILLVGRSRKMPVVVDDEIKIRLMMPMSLSYDHRLIDGATAARFLNEVIGYLEAPGRLLLAP